MVAEQRRFVHDVVKPSTGDFTVSEQPELIILKHAQETYARSVEEYAGKEIHGLPRAGHIPSAINISWNQFLQKDATVKPADQVRNIFEDHGRQPRRLLRIVWGVSENCLGVLSALVCGI